MDLIYESRRMKIAYFLDIPHGLGGAGNLLLQQARLMAKIYDVLVIIPRNSAGKANEEYEVRCKRYELPYQSLNYSTSFNFRDIDFCDAIENVFEIEKIVKKENISFFHSVQLNIAVEYVARKYRIPHVMDIYQLKKEEFLCCPGDIYPHYHICDSEMYTEMWSSQLGISSRCVRPIALLDSMQKKVHVWRNKLRILMLGSVCARKNQLAAIKACELCKDRLDIELTIAGELNSEYAKQCEEYVNERELGSIVSFTGFVSDVSVLLEKNDCLLCTSTEESFPSSMVEALSYDLTIISTPVAGVPEIFSNGKNAFISTDFSERSISKCILECADSYKTKEIISIHSNAEVTWKENFERNRVREQINDFYLEVSRGKISEESDFHNIALEVEQTMKILSDIYSDNKEMQARALYHTKLRKELKCGKMYLWGAGKMGALAYQILSAICNGLEIVAFVDSNKIGTYMGIPIIKLEDMPINEEYLYGISFINGKEEAISFLEKEGLELNKQIWIMP